MFDEICTKMSLDPEMKNQIYSLHIPNDYKCFQTKRFYSLFSLNEFSNLQTFKSNFSNIWLGNDILSKREEPDVKW